MEPLVHVSLKNILIDRKLDILQIHSLFKLDRSKSCSIKYNRVFIQSNNMRISVFCQMKPPLCIINSSDPQKHWFQRGCGTIWILFYFVKEGGTNLLYIKVFFNLNLHKFNIIIWKKHTPEPTSRIKFIWIVFGIKLIIVVKNTIRQHV